MDIFGRAIILPAPLSCSYLFLKDLRPLQLFLQCYLEFLRNAPTPYQLLITDSPFLRLAAPQKVS